VGGGGGRGMVGGPLGRFAKVEGGFMIDLGDDDDCWADLYGIVATDRRFWLWFHGPMSITGDKISALGVEVMSFSSDASGGSKSILVPTTTSNSFTTDTGCCFPPFDDLIDGFSSMYTNPRESGRPKVVSVSFRLAVGRRALNGGLGNCIRGLVGGLGLGVRVSVSLLSLSTCSNLGVSKCAWPVEFFGEGI
jgi:hypothetical protein